MYLTDEKDPTDEIDTPVLLSEASRVTNVPEATLRYYRHLGTGPKSFKVGRRVMYRRKDLTAWLQAQYDAAEPTPAA